MKYRTLGRTGMKVSPLCLGAMMFGEWGNPDHDDSVKIIHAAIDAGINFIDTADVYSAGESEEIVAKAIVGRRDDLVIATKVHSPMGEDPNRSGNSRRWIIAECENSLRRLGTDHIDLYQIHRFDPRSTSTRRWARSTDLVHQGKVRYLGSSTFPASAIVEGQWVAEKRNLQRFVCEQPPYSLLVRGIETDVLPTCERYDMGVIPWSPLAGGWLSGKWRSDSERPDESPGPRIPDRYNLDRPRTRPSSKRRRRSATWPTRPGCSLIHMALAFVINHPAVTSAIIGPRTAEHFEGQIGAADVVLERDVLDRIDEIVPPGSNFSWADAGWVPPSIGSAWKRRRVHR